MLDLSPGTRSSSTFAKPFNLQFGLSSVQLGELECREATQPLRKGCSNEDQADKRVDIELR